MAKSAKAKRTAAGSSKKAKGTKKSSSHDQDMADQTQSLSLHIGLNSVSPAHYGGWSGELTACEFDANDMAAIARAERHEADRAADAGRHARQHAGGDSRARRSS